MTLTFIFVHKHRERERGRDSAKWFVTCETKCRVLMREQKKHTKIINFDAGNGNQSKWIIETCDCSMQTNALACRDAMMLSCHFW